MIAALPMYDWPEIRDATDQFWEVWRHRLLARGIDAPQRLTRGMPCEQIWTHPKLLVAQTCGWPYVSGQCGDARLVATPCYAAEGCDGAMYRSWIVTRADDETALEVAGRRMAVNGRHSLSGWRLAAAAYEGRVSIIETGAHLESMRAVAEGRADVAAIDVIAWGLARVWRPELAKRLAVRAATPAAPGLPLITAGTRPDQAVEDLRATLREALAAPEAAAARAAMMLKDAVALSDQDYAPLRQLCPKAAV